MQFIRPRIDNPAVTADIMAPDSLKIVLINACYDCHSNLTRLAWFDKIAPASWLVAGDVRRARKVLNFSEWGHLVKERQKGILFESLNQMEFHVMPLRQYKFLHPPARIGDKETNLLRSYLSTLLTIPAPDTAKTRAWDVQYAQWTRGVLAPRNVKPALNGIRFPAGYKDWAAISSTERRDDGGLRIIVGNDLAVKAIKTNHTNPWPDGSTFAKIAWTQVLDSSGDIGAGEFKQVAFMIKDKDKYSSTDGWGFATWVQQGTQLTPYGKNALFTSECVNCHRPMKEYDFVFTMPIDLRSQHELEDKVICCFVNKRDGTMSTLYGNDIAARSARRGMGNGYPAGSVLTLVTWVQKGDVHWFGANIPDSIRFVEKVRFSDAGNGEPSPVYEKFAGNPLKRADAGNLHAVKGRLRYILGQRAAVLP